MLRYAEPRWAPRVRLAKDKMTGEKTAELFWLFFQPYDQADLRLIRQYDTYFDVKPGFIHFAQPASPTAYYYYCLKIYAKKFENAFFIYCRVTIYISPHFHFAPSVASFCFLGIGADAVDRISSVSHISTNNEAWFTLAALSPLRLMMIRHLQIYSFIIFNAMRTSRSLLIRWAKLRRRFISLSKLFTIYTCDDVASESQEN